MVRSLLPLHRNNGPALLLQLLLLLALSCIFSCRVLGSWWEFLDVLIKPYLDDEALFLQSAQPKNGSSQLPRSGKPNTAEKGAPSKGKGKGDKGKGKGADARANDAKAKGKGKTGKGKDGKGKDSRQQGREPKGKGGKHGSGKGKNKNH